MQIEVLGSGHEVGKSAILVEDEKTRIMLDYKETLRHGLTSWEELEKALSNQTNLVSVRELVLVENTLLLLNKHMNISSLFAVKKMLN